MAASVRTTKGTGRRAPKAPPVSAQFYSALAGASKEQPASQASRRRVMGLLQAISARLQAIATEIASQTGLHTTDLFVLAFIYRMSPDHIVRASAIQQALGFTAGGVTRRVAAMMRAGLVDRRPDPEDGRAWLIQLTDRGEDLAKRLLDENDIRNQRLQDGFSSEEWDRLIALLSRVHDLLG